MKIVGKLAKTLDDAIMSGANAALKSWNWTTGGTRAQLANGLLTIAPILETTAGVAIGGHIVGILAGGGLIAISHMYQKENTKYEEMEIRAIENKVKDIEVEQFKERNLFRAYGYLAPTGLLTHSSFKETSNLDFAMPTAFLVRSASHFISRCDYLPPRKNCVSRGIEALDELVDRYILPEPKPALQLS